MDNTESHSVRDVRVPRHSKSAPMNESQSWAWSRERSEPEKSTNIRRAIDPKAAYVAIWELWKTSKQSAKRALMIIEVRAARRRAR
jgi:hypothetical protein